MVDYYGGKHMFKFLYNLIKDEIKRKEDITLYFKGGFIKLPEYGEHIIDNSLIYHSLGTPHFIPMAGVALYVFGTRKEKRIVVNDSFSSLPTWVQEAIIAHECGHIEVDNDFIQFGEEGYFDIELQCDLFAVERGYDMLGALLYLMTKHPSTFSYERLSNLSKATNTPLPFYIEKFLKYF